MSNLLTISYGDTKTGPELMETVLQKMADAGAVFEVEAVQLGHEMERLEFTDGFDSEGIAKIRRAGVLLKAPTIKDVTTNLRAALDDETKIFEPTDNTPEAMLKATIEMLKYFGLDEVIDRIANN